VRTVSKISGLVAVASIFLFFVLVAVDFILYINPYANEMHAIPAMIITIAMACNLVTRSLRKK
jgi:hypothetical protein